MGSTSRLWLERCRGIIAPRKPDRGTRCRSFRPCLPVLRVLVLIVTLLPDDLHHIVLDGITALKRLIGIVAFLLLGLALYGVPPLYRSS